MKVIHIAFSALLLGAFTVPTFAQDYIGVDAVLKRVEDANAKPGEKPAHDAQAILRDDLKAFSESSSNLAPAAAAAQWLALVDRATKQENPTQFGFNPSTKSITGDDLLNVLPPPASWAELSKTVATRPPAKIDFEFRESGLRFLADTLTGDTEARTREFAAFFAKASSNSQTAMIYQPFVQQYSQAMLQTSDRPDIILKSLERQLSDASQIGMQPVNIPNLVSQVGPEKTEAFLRRALQTQNVTLQFMQANKTSEMAQKLALEMIDKLRAPQWGLINSLDALDLYEAMNKRFGNDTNTATDTPSIPGLPPDANVQVNRNTFGDFEKEQARIFYMLGLISKDRAKEAVVVAKQFSGQMNNYWFMEAFKGMERAGFSGAVDNFLYELLTQNPGLSFWDEYVDIAAKAGKTERMLALVRSTLGREDLTEKNKANLRRVLFKAELADDKVNEGVEEIRKLIALNFTDPSESGYSAGQLGVLMAQIGQLLKKPEWTDEGVKAAKQWLGTNSEKIAPYQYDMGGNNVIGPLCKILFEIKRGPEAEVILADALAKATQPNPANKMLNMRRSAAQPILIELATLYSRAGRNEDVLKLLVESPNWGVNDLSALSKVSPQEEQMQMMGLHTGVSPLPVTYLAAKAFLATGKTNEAAKVDDSLLNSYPGLDRGYELLLAILGSNAVPRLDELFARDQFEERPLIWKAHILREENQLDEAEKVVRHAIAIDPSDGEEGRGDRMRAYAELADILAARGNTTDANIYRGAVTAIRLSEDADQFYTAGLLKRAIAMYEEGLKHFADAYCIQSRLAIQMSALGMNQAAEEHYRRAYELMPDSFGRVESHCFGCERAFEGERAQNLAEQVFTKIEAERPEKPQVHYLLGYLHQEEEKFNEARTNYLEAVKLDPDYLNAWVKLQEVGEQTLLSPKQRDDIAFNILRLDPLQRHSNPSFEHVSDLAGLWNAAAAAASHQVTVSTNLYELTASRQALEKQKKSGAEPSSPQEELMQQEFEMENEMPFSSKNLSPAQAVAQTPFVRLAGQMIFSGGNVVGY